MAKRIARGAFPSAAIKAKYQRSLTAMVEEMRDSVLWWIRARYRAREDDIKIVAMDASAPRELEDEIRRLLGFWDRKFHKFARREAKRLADSTNKDTTRQLYNALRDAGLIVRFRNSKYVNNMLQSIIVENVGLIRSIPQQFLGDVRTIVMQSVQNGRDMGYITRQIQTRYKVSRNRAITIARDQTNKATEAISRARCAEVGITHGIWMHRSGGKVPRKTHEAMDGERFALEEGLYDSDVGENVKPGELVNCFPGDSHLHGFPFAEKLYRRFYSGELAQVVTDNGTVFSVTPNHPILTLKGWKPAGLLNEDDYVLQTCGDNVSAGEFYKQGTVPTFQQLFDSFVLAGATTTVFDGSASQFHGDGTDCEVDVIDINGLLANVSDAQVVQKGGEFGFSASDVAAISGLLTGQRPAQEFFAAVNSSPDRIMSGLRERLPIFVRSLSIAEFVRLLLIADCNLGHVQTATDDLSATPEMLGNGVFAFSGFIHGFDFLVRDDGPIARALWSGNSNAALPKVDAQRAGVNPKLLSDIFEQFSSSNGFGRVVKNVRRNFYGHVYNLQTTLGWYIAENTVSYNCHCTFKLDLSSILPGEEVAA